MVLPTASGGVWEIALLVAGRSADASAGSGAPPAVCIKTVFNVKDNKNVFIVLVSILSNLSLKVLMITNCCKTPFPSQ